MRGLEMSQQTVAKPGKFKDLLADMNAHGGFLLLLLLILSFLLFASPPLPCVSEATDAVLSILQLSR